MLCRSPGPGHFAFKAYSSGGASLQILADATGGDGTDILRHGEAVLAGMDHEQFREPEVFDGDCHGLRHLW